MNGPAPQPHRAQSLPLVIGAVIGAIIGFALGAGAYLLLDPWLEERSGLLREMQGFAFNLVPLLTITGGALAGWWAWRRSRT